MTDWAKDVLSKHFPTKTQALLDSARADATARRSILDRDAERRWLSFRAAIDNAAKDINETSGRRLLVSSSPKVAEIQIEKADGTSVFAGEYQAPDHQIVFTAPGKVSAAIAQRHPKVVRRTASGYLVVDRTQ